MINWSAKLNFNQTMQNTIQWYKMNKNNINITNQQIKDYFNENKFIKFYEEYILKLNNYLENINRNELIKLEEYFKRSINKNNKIFIAGNGGSAATASTMANDLGFDLFKKNKKINIQSLVDNTSIVTAISNDTGYTNLFLNQLKLYYRKGDALLVISASGNSKNLIDAIKFVKKIKVKLYLF